MSLQEKKIITNIFSTIIITTIFLIIVLNRFNQETLDIAGELVFWAKALLIFIPISIVARIIILILFHIGDSIANEIKGEKEEEYDLVDERDKLIELKATRTSLVLFSAGFIVSLILLAFGYSVTVFFITSLIFGAVSDFASEGSKIWLYRRGV